MKDARLYVVLASLLVLCGCRTTSILSSVGNQAQYSAERRGYVVSTLANPDDAILLVDPLRLRKARCREELEMWIRAWSEVLPDRVSDSAWENNSYGYMFPFTTVTIAGAIAAGAVLLGPYEASRVPYYVASSRSSNGLFDDALRDFGSQGYDLAARGLENVLVKGGLDPARSRYVHYYLGLAYEQLGRRELAAETLTRFIETSTASDAHAYDIAEGRLPALQGHGMPPCRSQEPVTMLWRND